MKQTEKGALGDVAYKIHKGVLHSLFSLFAICLKILAKNLWHTRESLFMA
jgi:hypothetical protein